MRVVATKSWISALIVGWSLPLAAATEAAQPSFDCRKASGPIEGREQCEREGEDVADCLGTKYSSRLSVLFAQVPLLESLR
jgi:uncharacterized protein